ncbi:MAG TPA: ABC transporter permease [Streptosporangiaceae bacterium]|nr:ABC transporter permease [Streptosporangiaceae bacterium]
MSVSTGTAATRRGSPAEPAAGAGSLPTLGVIVGPQARPAAPDRSRRRRGWLRLISPIVVLALWQIASTTGLVSQQKLPSLTTLWSTAVHLITTSSPTYGTLQGAMAISLERMAIGFAIGGSIGVILAVLAGLSRLGENSVDPIMQALRTLPLFGLIPVFIVWFGIGNTPKITLIALAAAIPLYLTTFAGIRGVDGKLAELGQVLGLRRRELIRHVVLPGALPMILVGLRQSLGAAWLALIVAEQINTNAGLGFIINQAESFLQMNDIFVALLVYLVLGLLTDSLVRLIERRALAWRRGIMEP